MSGSVYKWENISGKIGRDIVTGFTGVIYGHSKYMTGCDQILLVPMAGSAHEDKESRWFDDVRIEVVGTSGLQFKQPADGTDASRGGEIPAPTK